MLLISLIGGEKPLCLNEFFHITNMNGHTDKIHTLSLPKVGLVMLLYFSFLLIFLLFPTILHKSLALVTKVRILIFSLNLVFRVFSHLN